MTSPTLLRHLEAAEHALTGAPVAVLVSPDPDAPAEVTAFEQRLSQLKTDPYRQIIIIDTGIRQGELT